MKKLLCSFAAAAVLAVGAIPAAAQDAKVVPVLTGLLNPSGLVMQPGTNHMLVSDSGAGRILCFHIDDWHYDKCILKFAKDVYGKGPMYDIGPLGMCFAGKTLVVGGGDQVDGKEVVYFFDVPPHGQTVEASKAKFTAGPIAEGHKDSPKGEGNFFGVAYTNNSVYVTSNGDDTKGWVLKTAVAKDGKPGELTPFIATKTKVNVDAPVAITVNDKGQLVIGQMGEVKEPAGDSLLTVYDAKSGDLVSSAKCGLNDICGLAYGPKSKKLYAIDFSWSKPEDGGLFRLDVSGEGKDMTVKAVKLAKLDKPAAMCFGADGKLYVAEFGTQAEGSKERPGRLVMIDADL
jgi:hypothetical protein